MALTFKPVTTENDIEHLHEMAVEIWNEYWPALIGQAQTDYMVDLFLSVDAIKAEMAEKDYRFWFLVDEHSTEVGFTGGATEQLTGSAQHDDAITVSQVINERWPLRFFISKVYLYADQRGKHYASRVLDFYEQLCRDENLPVMYLTVNRDNELGVRAYRGRGFDVMEEVDNDIGSGFVMTDFVMAKPIA